MFLTDFKKEEIMHNSNVQSGTKNRNFDISIKLEVIKNL